MGGKEIKEAADGARKVTDLDSGKVYVPEDGRITLPVTCGESIWLLLEKE